MSNAAHNHDRLLTQAITAARAAAWSGTAETDRYAERAAREYVDHCRLMGLEPFPIRITS